VSNHLGRSNTWAAPYLAAAVTEGRIVAKQEQVPRTKGLTTVYRPYHSTAGGESCGE
jgi:hypothetical protein